MSDDGAPKPPEILLYETEDGRARVECRFEEGNLWLTQALMAELFAVSLPNINEHLKAIYNEGELDKEATLRKYRRVQVEGEREVTRQLQHYSLPAILAVGYRVRSVRGTQFRRWATERLEEYLVKGFTMDDERLRNPPGPGVADHFDELLERIRDIRASEARMYLRVRDVLSLAADYGGAAEEDVRDFFKEVQNKLHFATTGRTAPEVIADRADAGKPNMGLTAFTGKRVTKADATVAKNFYNEAEIASLNRVVVMFLDYAEDQASRRKQVTLARWREKLDGFLEFNDREVLTGHGSVSRAAADARAHGEYAKFAERRRAIAEAAGEAELKALAREVERRPKRPEPGGEG